MACMVTEREGPQAGTGALGIGRQRGSKGGSSRKRGYGPLRVGPQQASGAPQPRNFQDAHQTVVEPVATSWWHRCRQLRNCIVTYTHVISKVSTRWQQ